jgi:hypothetical protein
MKDPTDMKHPTDRLVDETERHALEVTRGERGKIAI